MGRQLSIEPKLLDAGDLHNLLLNSGKFYSSSLSLIRQSLINLVLIVFSAAFSFIYLFIFKYKYPAETLKEC